MMLNMMAVFGSYFNLVLLATVSTNESDYVFNRMSGITRYLYENLPSYEIVAMQHLFLYSLCRQLYIN